MDAQYLQIDPHMRTHAGQQYTYTGSQPATAYMGLGAAAQAAFNEADHITGVLLEETGVATAAMTQVRHCHLPLAAAAAARTSALLSCSQESSAAVRHSVNFTPSVLTVRLGSEF